MNSNSVKLVLLVSLVAMGCQTSSYRQRGAGLGAVGGALAGAAMVGTLATTCRRHRMRRQLADNALAVIGITWHMLYFLLYFFAV